MTTYSTTEPTKPTVPDSDSIGRARRLCLSARRAFERDQRLEAAELYKRAIRILEEAGEGEEIEKLRVWSLVNLAEVYQSHGHYQEAEPFLREALASAEQVFGPDDPLLATALNNLAVLYKYMGRFTEAGQLYQRALSIVSRVFGPDHPETATIYHNLGGLEHAAGNYLRGEPFARRSVEIRQRVLGPDHPDTAADMAALAALLDGRGKYAEAEHLYRRALAVFERVYGPEHYEIAVNLNNLAAIAHTQGRKDEAEQLYRRALAMKESLLGPEHPDVAMTLHNLAVFSKSNQQYAEAEQFYSRALSIFEKALGPQHLNIAICLNHYAQLLAKVGRIEEARVLKTRAGAIRSSLGLLKKNDVVATATINTQVAGFALTVCPSQIHRWGVFTEERIPPHRTVIEYTGTRIDRRTAAKRRRSRDYLFTLDENWLVDGADGGSGAELINHSCDPNLYSSRREDRILYLSKREIEPGEELTVDYSFAPDQPPVPCRCGSTNCRATINQKPLGIPDITGRG